MKGRTKKPFSLRVRFMMATAAVVLALSLAYGLVAVVGYMVSFDKTAYRLLRGESNLFFSLAQWREGKLSINVPPDLDLNTPTLVLFMTPTVNCCGRNAASRNWKLRSIKRG